MEIHLLDLGEDRLALIDETGLDVQVLSLTTPKLHDFGPECLDLARPPSVRHARYPSASALMKSPQPSVINIHLFATPRISVPSPVHSS